MKQLKGCEENKEIQEDVQNIEELCSKILCAIVGSTIMDGVGYFCHIREYVLIRVMT